jgi:hypothetical protein
MHTLPEHKLHLVNLKGTKVVISKKLFWLIGVDAPIAKKKNIF